MSIDVQWREEYRIDNSIIDTQHKWLLKLAGDLLAIDPLSQKFEETKSIILQLYQYMEFHFQREEQLAKQIGYPKLEAHAKSHRIIIDKMNAMMTSCTTFDELRPTLHGIFSDWIQRHVMIMDKDIALFVKNQNP